MSFKRLCLNIQNAMVTCGSCYCNRFLWLRETAKYCRLSMFRKGDSADFFFLILEVEILIVSTFNSEVFVILSIISVPITYIEWNTIQNFKTNMLINDFNYGFCYRYLINCHVLTEAYDKKQYVLIQIYTYILNESCIYLQ